MIDINNINPIIKKLLEDRQINSKAEIFDFFYQDIYSLSNPFEIKEVNVFIDRVRYAINSKEKILIYGDKDADGITSTSLIFNTLKKVASGNVHGFMPNHQTGYGLSKMVIEEYAREGFSLIITVDCGISNIEEVEFARALGIDIIITDHHDIPQTLPNAYAIYNPKLKNSGFAGVNYSGCAVAFKLMQALVFSYSKFYNQDSIVLDYEVDKNDNSLKYIKALRLKNFVPDDDIFAFEKTEDGHYKIMFNSYLEESLSEEEVLEELASYMFEGDSVVLVLTGGEERLKKLLSLYEKYEIYLPKYEEVFNLLSLAEHYGHIDLKATKTLKDFALALNVNIYRYENMDYSDMLIKVAIFQRLFYLSQKRLNEFIKRKSILVGLATIADIIPLIGESRVYVRSGLENINNSTHIRYKTLLNKLKINMANGIDVIAVSWRIAPFINAAGRMGKPEEAFNLLISECEEDANIASESIFNMNEKRKALTDENFIFATSEIKHNQLDKETVIIVRSHLIDKGLTGLIAGRVLSEHKKTTIVLSEDLESQICVGSVRSRGANNARAMLESASDLLIKYGGHKNAAGFSIESSKMDEFNKLVQHYSIDNGFDNDTETLEYSLKLSFRDVTICLAEDLESFKPYGACNEEPLFASYNITIQSIRKIEKNNKLHLIFTLASDGKCLQGIIWNVKASEYLEISQSKMINIIYKIEVNRFNGKSEAQLIIEKYSLL